MKELIVVVEGETDVPFIRYYINLIIQNCNLNFVQLSDESFIKTGSKDALYLTIQIIEGKLINGKQVIVLFDADKDYGTSLKNVNKQLTQPVPTFLFPDNKNTGTLETLLCQIVPKEHQVIFGCYDDYAKCINSLNKYKSTKEKGKILSYVEIVTPLNKAISLKQVNSFDTEYWDIESEYLTPLKNFLIKINSTTQ